MKFKSPDYYTKSQQPRTNQPIGQKPVRPAEAVVETRVVKAPVPPSQKTFWEDVVSLIEKLFG